MLRTTKHTNATLLKSLNVLRYQKSTEHVEADEVEDSEVAATGLLLSRVIVGLRVTQFARQTRQHNLLPCLTCCTSDIQ